MACKATLHVCHLDRAGSGIHFCRRADDALVAAGIDHDRVVFGPNKPLGLLAGGARPALKAISG